MTLPTCQQYRALKGLNLALHVLLDDAHEARAAELVPTRVQRTRVRSAQRSSRPPEHERHERARAPQRGALQQRASGYLWREHLERGCPGRRLRNALGTHVDQRERAAAPKIAAPAAPTARSIQLHDPAARSAARSSLHGPSPNEVPRSATEEASSHPGLHAMLLTTRRFDRSVVARHAILRKHAVTRALDSRWHRPGVHSAC